MDWTPFLKLVESGGAVLIAVVVVAVLIGGTIYLGHRFLYLPSQRLTREIAKANAQAAEAHAQAAQAHQQAAASNEEASKFNSETSQQNARTAAHLERLTEMLLSAALGQKKS